MTFLTDLSLIDRNKPNKSCSNRTVYKSIWYEYIPGMKVSSNKTDISNQKQTHFQNKTQQFYNNDNSDNNKHLFLNTCMLHNQNIDISICI